jgi:hypothetical protein
MLSLPQMVQPYAFLSLSSNSGLININISNPLINNNSVTQSIIEQTMNGDIYYTPEDTLKI